VNVAVPGADVGTGGSVTHKQTDMSFAYNEITGVTKERVRRAACNGGVKLIRAARICCIGAGTTETETGLFLFTQPIKTQPIVPAHGPTQPTHDQYLILVWYSTWYTVFDNS